MKLDLIGRTRRRIPRDSRRARAFEPLASILTVYRGSFRPTLAYARRHGLDVKTGPFAGMRYPRSAVLEIPGLVPHLVGTYELELHPIVEKLIAAAPELVVNIGAGNGCYAVGIALRCPQARVVAYEADPYMASICTRIARFNGVEDRIDLRATCTVEALAELEPPPGTVVICDCEGAERELIDPDRVPWLGDARLLIEAHESFVPGIEAELRQRLEPTHRTEQIVPGKRYLEDRPQLWGTPAVSTIQLETLMSELRPWRTPWIWAVPS